MQLLQKLVVRAAGNDSHVALLKVVKNPVTQHLPIGCVKVMLSAVSRLLVNTFFIDWYVL